MSEWSERLSSELDELRRVRDELRVQAHLAAAEVRDLWDETEDKLGQLDSKVKAVSSVAEQELEEVGRAARGLVDEIRTAYERIRRSL